MYTREISVPESVSIEIQVNVVKVSGPKGELKRNFKLAHGIKIKKEDSKVKVESEDDKRKPKALVGTIIAHIRNMFKGVREGYTYKMKVVYSHFPVTVKIEGKKILVNNFLGERTPRVAKVVGDAKVEIQGQDITITAVDAEEAGQTAGNIEQACRIVGYDKRRFSDGIFIMEKKI